MKEELQNKIDRYLMNQMTDEERMAFEKETEGNDELQEQLLFTEEIQQVLKSRNDKLLKMREWEQEETHNDDHHSEKQIYLWISGIAAVLIVGIFTINTYLIPDDNSSISDNMSTIADKSSGEYQIIDKLLAKSDYTKALEEIEKEEYKILMQDRDELIIITEPDGTIIIDSVAADTAVAFDDIDFEIVPESTEPTETELDKRNESELNNREDKTADANDNQNSDTVYILDFVKDPQNKEKVEHLYLMKAKAFIGLNRIGEALSLLDKLRSSDNKYKTQADSIYKSLKR